MTRQKVEPIKDDQTLKQVKDTLLDSFKLGRRNLCIFQVGKATLLRVSDVLKLRYDDVFNAKGIVKEEAYIHDQKTGKANKLYLKPVKNDLRDYHDWLIENNINSQWLFPSSQSTRHINEKQFYKIMHKVGDLLGLDYLGTHTMRKTGAYLVYEQTNYDISLVMDLLNHSSQNMTLRYLGLDEETKHNKLDNINFG